MHDNPSRTELRRHPRYEIEDVVVVTSEGVCQLGDISEGGLSFKCLYLQDIPDSCTIDLLNTSGTHLHKLEVDKVWEKKRDTEGFAELFSHTVGARFKDLTPEQEVILRHLLVNNRSGQA